MLVEAMSTRVPVVSFDCDFGPWEIITLGISGILVPPRDIPALSKAIGNLVTDDELRGRLEQEGFESIGRFAPDEILNRWESLLRDVTARPVALREAQKPPPHSVKRL